MFFIWNNLGITSITNGNGELLYKKYFYYINFEKINKIYLTRILSNLEKNELSRIMSLSIITNDIHNKNTNQNLDLCRKIPLLEDVFKICSNVHINLDIKIDNDELILKVCI